jgi:hypothetical protein
MESHASKQLVAQLFSHDHNAVNDYIAGLTTMCDFYSNVEEGDEIAVPVCLANLDLPLKYASIKVHESQSNLVGKCVDLIEALISFMTTVNYQLSEGEAICFIPTFIYKASNLLSYELSPDIFSVGRRKRADPHQSPKYYPIIAQSVCIQQSFPALVRAWPQVQGGQDQAR